MEAKKLIRYTEFKKELQEKVDKGIISTEEYERRIIEYCKENKV